MNAMLEYSKLFQVIEILRDYFSDEETAELASAIYSFETAPIIIDGAQNPTGKTTLCAALKALGYNAYEPWESEDKKSEDKSPDNSFEIVIRLNKPVNFRR